MHAGLRSVAVALCLVTAGCTGLFGAQQPTAVETVTPAPVPESPPERVAPGLTAAGVVDSDALVRAHVAQLSNTSYTVQHRRKVVDENGTVLRRQYTRIETSARYERYAAIRTIDGESVTDSEVRVEWENGTASEVRTENGTFTGKSVAITGSTGSQSYPGDRYLFLEVTHERRIQALFAGVNVTSVVPAHQVISQLHGARVLRVNADGAADPSLLPIAPADRVERVGFTATVTPDGFARSYSVQYTVVRNGTRLRVTESLWYSDVGETEPDLE